MVEIQTRFGRNFAAMDSMADLPQAILTARQQQIAVTRVRLATDTPDTENLGLIYWGATEQPHADWRAKYFTLPVPGIYLEDMTDITLSGFETIYQNACLLLVVDPGATPNSSRNFISRLAAAMSLAPPVPTDDGESLIGHYADGAMREFMEGHIARVEAARTVVTPNPLVDIAITDLLGGQRAKITLRKARKCLLK